MTRASEITVRNWTRGDIPAVLPLMRDLAVFEQYIDSFKVTETALLEQGFNLEPPNFYVLVAELDGRIVGILVYYFLPFSASAKPVLYVKELFITQAARGLGAGKALMQRAALEARARGCGGLRWAVASWNDPAKGFYESLGAFSNPVWIEYGLGSDALETLAGQT